jgi:hypothetical protein
MRIFALSIATHMLDISAMDKIAKENPNSDTRYIHTMPARPPLGSM